MINQQSSMTLIWSYNQRENSPAVFLIVGFTCVSCAPVSPEYFRHTGLHRSRIDWSFKKNEPINEFRRHIAIGIGGMARRNFWTLIK